MSMPNEKKQKEFESSTKMSSKSDSKIYSTDYKAVKNYGSNKKKNRKNYSANDYSSNNIGGFNNKNNKIDNGRLDSVGFEGHKGPSFLDNTLNAAILNDGGVNLEGLTIENANLNRITTAGKLPIFGENLYVDGALDNGAFGDSGYILQELINELPFITNKITTIDDFNNAATRMNLTTAAMPFTMSKTLIHNYKGLDDITSSKSKNTYAKTLFFEDMSDVMQTFMDSYGTKYVVNDLRITIGNDTLPAFPYISYYYDVVMLHVMTVFRHYENFKSMLHYGEKVSVIRNDVLNELDGPIFRSSTMIGAQTSAVSALTKLPLPIKYFSTYISSVFNNGKVTTGRITPMEYVNCDVAKPTFLDIKNVNSNQVYMPATVWTNLWSAADNVIAAYDLVAWDNWIFKDSNINAWPVLDKRRELITVWQTFTQALNVFYNHMYDYLVALQRGLKGGVIKCYTDPSKITDQISGIKMLQDLSKGVEGNNAMINAYNYINQLVTTEMNNGVLIKGDFVPDLVLKGIISHDSLLVFIGEENQYARLYDVSQPVTITINNPGFNNKTSDQSIPYFKLVADNPTDLSTGRWRLHNIYSSNGTLRSEPIAFNHPFIHYLLGNAVVNLVFSAKMTGVQGGSSSSTIVVQDSRVYTTIEYTLNTIGKYVSNMFKFYSTR